MKIGITGTREGATLGQIDLITEFLQLHQFCGFEFHHGDCKGVDEEAASIAKALGYKIICHPPAKNYLRAYFPSDETREPAGYFERDRAIVDETDFLIVVPLQTSPQTTGGTWYTHDYAVKKNKRLVIYYPEE